METIIVGIEDIEDGEGYNRYGGVGSFHCRLIWNLEKEKNIQINHLFQGEIIQIKIISDRWLPFDENRRKKAVLQVN